MAIVKSVDLKWDRKKLGELVREYREGVFEMGYDMAALARENAPYITGALRNSIRVEENADKTAVNVIAGGIVSSGTYNGQEIRRMVDYAWKTEQHSSRPHYMERAQKAIMTGNWVKKYFGGR